jgi:hypothetical protein
MPGPLYQRQVVVFLAANAFWSGNSKPADPPIPGSQERVAWGRELEKRIERRKEMV